MTYKIVTEEARVINARDFVSDIGEGVDGMYTYYVFLGKHTQYSETSDIATKPVDSDKFKRSVYDEMLFGKKVTANDARVMVSRHDYVIGTVYDMYDDTDALLYGKKYFTVVKRGTEHDVFKCLYNGDGVISTIPPNKLDITNYDEIYRTSDGYIWKYMFSIPYADMEKFATTSLIPVIANTDVTAAAVGGSIDVIDVEFSGSRYDNYLAGTLGKNDISINGNKRQLDISSASKASNLDDFYKGCIFKIVSGTYAGLYSKINTYEVSEQQKIITLTIELPIQNNTEYEISPEVIIEGDILGNSDPNSEARARAIISDVGNVVSRVEILNRGYDYRIATAYVYSSGVVPVVANSTVRPILGPYGGHGYNANAELAATRACFSVTFNEDSDNLPSMNDFRQIGVIANPSFANVEIKLSPKDGTTFITGETAYQINPVRLYASGVTVSLSSNSVTASEASFDNLEANTIVYIIGGAYKQLATVSSIPDSTSLTLRSDSLFACTDCQIYIANVSTSATVITDIFEGVSVTDLRVPFEAGKAVVGYESGAYGIVSQMSLANTAVDLSTFNQMWKFYVTTSSAFELDEIIYQPTSAANSHGNLFGFVDSGLNKIMYLSNQFSYINTGEDVVGLTSGDSAYVASSYPPDLSYTSGRILYLENIEKVTRTPGQKETFKIIFSY